MEKESSRMMSRREAYEYVWRSSSSSSSLGLLQAWPARSYSCGFCKREFRSAQALGGHMNVHRRERASQRQRQRLMITHAAASSPPLLLPPPDHEPPTNKREPPLLLPNLNHPPPLTPSAQRSPPLNLDLVLGRLANDPDDDDDDDGGLDLELRLASC